MQSMKILAKTIVPNFLLSGKVKDRPKGNFAILGWAKSINPNSRSKSLVSVIYNKNEQVVEMYYCASPKEAYEWEYYFRVPRNVIDKILQEKIIVKVTN